MVKHNKSFFTHEPQSVWQVVKKNGEILEIHARSALAEHGFVSFFQTVEFSLNGTVHKEQRRMCLFANDEISEVRCVHGVAGDWSVYIKQIAPPKPIPFIEPLSTPTTEPTATALPDPIVADNPTESASEEGFEEGLPDLDEVEVEEEEDYPAPAPTEDILEEDFPDFDNLPSSEELIAPTLSADERLKAQMQQYAQNIPMNTTYPKPNRLSQETQNKITALLEDDSTPALPPYPSDYDQHTEERVMVSLNRYLKFIQSAEKPTKFNLQEFTLYTQNHTQLPIDSSDISPIVFKGIKNKLIPINYFYDEATQNFLTTQHNEIASAWHMKQNVHKVYDSILTTNKNKKYAINVFDVLVYLMNSKLLELD